MPPAIHAVRALRSAVVTKKHWERADACGRILSVGTLLKPILLTGRPNEHVMTWLVYLALSALAQASPPQPPVPSTPPGQTVETAQMTTDRSSDSEELPVSLDRIQRALAQKPRLRLISEKPVFRVEIFGKKATIEDILGPDYLKGPVSGGAMTHQEFLAMVTPKDVQGYAAFTNGQGFVVAATSIALQWALQKAIHKYEDAKKEREREAARREVMDALAALQEARRKAGLPPK